MRTIYDPASQVTFITRDAVGKVNHKGLNSNYTIKISGFSESKIVTSKVFELSLGLNNKRRIFQTVVGPELKTKVNCRSISYICDTFKKEINVAGARLGESNDGNVDVLLEG